jgi:hypothetical protein
MKTFPISSRLLILSFLIAGLALFHFQASANWMYEMMPAFAEKANTTADTESDDDAQSMQVVLLLDTSNSMDGLIEQAKSQLWSILVALSQTRKKGDAPKLEMALYEYGNDGLASRSGYVRQVLSFTNDMDEVSAALFELSTNGGQEYCGEVIQQSLNDLKWSTHKEAVRMIFIAGNEGFNQGNTPYGTACADAKEKDIIVNTIYCGNCEEGEQLFWKDGAVLTGGHYNCMDHNQRTVYIETPYDQQIAKLNLELNDTYIPYGAQGNAKRQLQMEQDSNADQYGKANYANRAAFKASSNYKNTSWDLVDAYEEDPSVVEEAEALPEKLSGKSAPELKEHIEKVKAERAKIKQEMQKIGEKRAAYIKTERAKTQEDTSSLEDSVLEAIRAQAAAKGFTTE